MSDEQPDTALGKARQIAHNIFIRNGHLKAIALLLTVALYLWVGEDRETQMIAAAPVRFSVPEELILTQPNIDRVKLTLRGRWSSLNQFDQNDLEPVVIQVSPDDDGQVVPITPDAVQLPPGVRTTSIEPSAVRVELEDRVEKTVKLSPRVVGRTRPGYVIQGVEVTPSELTVSGPQSVIGPLQSVPTERIDVTGRARSFQKQVQLRPESSQINYNLSNPVSVSVQIAAEEAQRTLQGLKVRPVNTSYETEIEPANLDVTVRGPAATVEELDSEQVYAVLDLAPQDAQEPGTFEKKPTLRNIPDTVEIVRMQPEYFLVTTRAAEDDTQGSTD
jgi:YbbR domain-containing protein